MVFLFDRAIDWVLTTVKLAIVWARGPATTKANDWLADMRYPYQPYHIKKVRF